MELDLIRAWKDEAYYENLSDEQRALLPPSPIGAIELDDLALDAVHGGILSLRSGCHTAFVNCNTTIVLDPLP